MRSPREFNTLRHRPVYSPPQKTFQTSFSKLLLTCPDAGIMVLPDIYFENHETTGFLKNNAVNSMSP